MKFLFVTRYKIGVLLPALGQSKAAVVALSLMTVLILSAPRTARANSENSFLETIGTGAAVGSVLGASTLPFYGQPGKNLINIVYGASLGVVGGIGVSLYDRYKSNSADETTMSNRGNDPSLAYTSDSVRSSEAVPGTLNAVSANSVQPAHFAFWTPLVSLTW